MSEQDEGVVAPIILADQEMEQLARRLGQVKQSKQDLERQLEDVAAEEALLKSRLKEIMESREISKFHVSGVGLVYSQSTFYPKVVGDPQALISWLDQHEGADVAIRAIKAGRFKEYYETRLQDDQELPPSDLVEARSYAEIRFRADARGGSGE